MRIVRATVASALLLSALAAAAQEPPAIDRKDPQVVAKAYVEACQAGDLEALLALIGPDDPARPAITEAARQLNEGMAQAGFSPVGFLTEFLFLPFKVQASVQEAGADVKDATATVRFTRDLVVQQQIVLERAADGTWFVNPIASVKATTGGKATLLERDVGGRDSGGGEPGIWASHNRLRRLQQACEEYAQEHGNRYPPAATWMDALDPYVLDPEAFKCPAGPDAQCGYAMNAALSEQPLPQDWNARRGLLLFFEWPGEQRNACALPEELARLKSCRPDGTIAAMDATGNTRTLHEGMA
jgi:hypothetical protein